MRIDPPPPRPRPETLLPMIDVVLFLIVFFMIVSQFADREPFSVVTPEAASVDQARGEFTLYLDATGQAGFVADGGVVLGDGVLAALLSARDGYCRETDCADAPPVLLVKADMAAPATQLAALLPELAGAGFGDIRLLTVPK
jgi:biopolymer transport protein ExbD